MTKEDKEETKMEVSKLRTDNLCKHMKEILDNRLVSSPCCIVMRTCGRTANMEQIIKVQALQDNSTMGYMMNKEDLETNPDYPIVETFRRLRWTKMTKLSRISWCCCLKLLWFLT